MIYLLLLYLCLPCSLSVSQSAQDEEVQSEERLPLEELLPSKTLEKYKEEEKYHNRIKILRKVFEANARVLEYHVQERDIANLYRSLAALRGLAFHSIQESLREKDEKELKHKEVKKLEIWLRKTEEHLEDLKLAVPLENRFQFEETYALFEALRERLLRQLFGQALGSRNVQNGMGFLPKASSAGTSTAQGLWDLDKFTEEEFTAIQLAQKLVKRVEAFLVIAESRLDEIDRRKEGKPWEEEEPNPLEFYTYEDLLYAYTRAVEGIMINIDEKATSQMETEEEIRKSLKKLSKKIEEFIPRLDSLEQLVIERKDEELGEKLLAAMKSSELAKKGAQFGLGAPEE